MKMSTGIMCTQFQEGKNMRLLHYADSAVNWTRR